LGEAARAAGALVLMQGIPSCARAICDLTDQWRRDGAILVIGVAVWSVIEVAKRHLDHTPMAS